MRVPKGICEKCLRAPKVKGQGQRYCVDCKEAADWAAERKRQTRLVVTRRPCLICGGVKEPGKGKDFCAKCREARRKKRKCMSCPAEIKAPARKCTRCRAVAKLARMQAERERHRRNRREHPEWYKRDRKRKRHSKKDNEGARMRHRLRQERQGRTVAPVSVLPRTYVPAVYHDAAPLVPFLRQTLTTTTLLELEERAGVGHLVLNGILDGTLREVRDFQADKLCVALGLQLTLLYPRLAQTG